MTASVPALQTQALTRSFGSHVVVDHLDLTVQAGEVGMDLHDAAGRRRAARLDPIDALRHE